MDFYCPKLGTALPQLTLGGKAVGIADQRGIIIAILLDPTVLKIPFAPHFLKQHAASIHGFVR